MSDDASARLGLPYLAAGQLQKHVTLNEALTRLDALTQTAVVSRTTTTQPAAPQLVIATDIWRPPGVSILRNGALAATSATAETSAPACARARPRNKNAPSASNARPVCGGSLLSNRSMASPGGGDAACRAALPAGPGLTGP